MIRALPLALLMAGPAMAQDLIETCAVAQSCTQDGACTAGKDVIGIATTFGSGDAATYEFRWNDTVVADLRDHDGHIFTWLLGDGDDQRSYAMSYIYNSQMPNPDEAEFLLIETRIQGRLTDTIMHSGICRESES